MMILVILEMMMMLVNLCCLEIALDLPPLLLLIILLTPFPVQVFVFLFQFFLVFCCSSFFFNICHLSRLYFSLIFCCSSCFRLIFVTCPGCPPAHPVSAPALSSPSTSGRPDHGCDQEFHPVVIFLKTFSSAACSSSLALLFTSWMCFFS